MELLPRVATSLARLSGSTELQRARRDSWEEVAYLRALQAECYRTVRHLVW